MIGLDLYLSGLLAGRSNKQAAYIENHQQLQREIEGFKTVYGDRFIGMRNGWPIILGKTRIPVVRRVK